MSLEQESRQKARGARVDAWLAAGGWVLAASERGARSAAAEFHAARQREGQRAWRTPAIYAWENWVREQWLERNTAGLMPLNLLQEQAIWKRVIGSSPAGQGLLHPGRLAGSAQQAYRLLCLYAPDLLPSPAWPGTGLASRLGWPGDAAVFAEWMEEFVSYCRQEQVVSASRMALDLAVQLKREPERESGGSGSRRPPLLLIGFDRLLKTQRTLLDAWGAWSAEEAADPARATRFYAASDETSELAACAHWLKTRLDADPEARLMVVTPHLQERRGELERALLPYSREDDALLDFEFSLGVPLGRMSVARSAALLLRWLAEPLQEPELDWLLSSGHCAGSAAEELALQGAMRELRRYGWDWPQWSLEEFAETVQSWDRNRDRGFRSAGQAAIQAAVQATTHTASWAARVNAACERLRAFPERRTPLEWAGAAGQLLGMLGWPGYRPLTSIVYQAKERLERVLDDCASLGFDGSRMEWAQFAFIAAEAVSETVFAAESSGARVLITEPLESAGQLADGIWFLGAHEEDWPARGQPHPLLPVGLQRETGMPHASSQADWQLAHEVTTRLLTSADEVIFSYAKQSAETELRPSRLAVQHLGAPRELDAELARGGDFGPDRVEQDRAGQDRAGMDQTESFEDTSLIPFPHAEIGGGAATLTRQSHCPFQAFAMVRLQAEDWESSQPGMTPQQRGQLLHAVLHRVWGGAATGGIGNLEELRSLPDLRAFVAGIVRRVMAHSFSPDSFDLNSFHRERRNAVRNRFPANRFPDRYLELEAERLTQLVCEWLEYERQRLPFSVAGTEVKQMVEIAGRRLTLRLDRIDELPDKGKLILDYKSSDVGPSAWEEERPDDLQLPLYATFAVREALEGLVFARVRPGDMRFCGRVREAGASLLPELSNRNALVSDPLTDAQLEEWRERIERLGRDFLAGRAEADPKIPGKTCESCHLHAVCRIYENAPQADLLEEEDAAGDEDA